MIKKAILIAAFIALTVASVLPSHQVYATSNPAPTPVVGDYPTAIHRVFLPVVLKNPLGR